MNQDYIKPDNWSIIEEGFDVERKTRLGIDDTLMNLTNIYLQYGVPLEDYDNFDNKLKYHRYPALFFSLHQILLL